jgi:DNA adenine methylase
VSIRDSAIAVPLEPLFPWFGGKSRAADIIWRRFGPVDNYVEPFFGSGAILFARPHEPGIETINDKDRYVANFWRAVQADPDAVAEAANWPVNEADLEARHYWLVTEGAKRLAELLTTPDGCDAKIAGWWVWGQCCWIGSGWCSGKGPWQATAEGWSLGNAGQGVNGQLPHLGDAGRGTSARHHEHLRGRIGAIADRLRYTRVCCGDWKRTLTPSVTFRHGSTGIVLDPPYGEGEVDYSVGGNRTGIAGEVREWAIINGENRDLRIALCGYDGQFEMPDSWSVESWTAAGGYSSTASGDTEGKENRHRERVWFSPNCISQSQGCLFQSSASLSSPACSEMGMA